MLGKNWRREYKGFENFEFGCWGILMELKERLESYLCKKDDNFGVKYFFLIKKF